MSFFECFCNLKLYFGRFCRKYRYFCNETVRNRSKYSFRLQKHSKKRHFKIKNRWNFLKSCHFVFYARHKSSIFILQTSKYFLCIFLPKYAIFVYFLTKIRYFLTKKFKKSFFCKIVKIDFYTILSERFVYFIMFYHFLTSYDV